MTVMVGDILIGVLRTTVLTTTNSTQYRLTDGSVDDGAYVGAYVMIPDSGEFRQITSYDGLTQTIGLESPTSRPLRAGDSIHIAVADDGRGRTVTKTTIAAPDIPTTYDVLSVRRKIFI